MTRTLVDQITDPSFRRAVDLMDTGQIDALRAHLTVHPGLITQRVQLDPGYFETPALMCFIAENPIRTGTMPANITDVAGVLIDAGTPPPILTETLMLVASGRIARETAAQTPLIAQICRAGADPNIPIMAALGHGEFSAITALLNAGADLTLPIAAATGHAADTERLLPDASALHRHQAVALASQHGHANTLKLLLDSGEDPNRYNPNGCHAHSTPLHQAALAGWGEVVQLLLSAGARTDMLDVIHNAPAIGWARHAGHVEIVEMLEA
jgi:hypothetical protein